MAHCQDSRTAGRGGLNMQKKRPTPTNEKPSDQNTAKFTALPFSLPAEQNTVTAEVAAMLLSGQEFTGMAAVFAAGTTRLSAVIYRLRREYGWTVLAQDVAVPCRDGRTATVAEYSLTPKDLEAARAAGVSVWCSEVFAARRERRAQVARAERIAKLKNAALRAGRAVLPGQLGLDLGGVE